MAPEIAKELNKFLMELVYTLVAVIEHKDPYLKGHSERVANMSLAFSKSLNLPQNNGLESIYFAGLLHDIGMVYIPMDILHKPGKLNANDMMVVRQHPVISESIVSHLSMIKPVLPIVRHHHEDVDGKGYPDGLKGDEIPVGARILHLVDSFDAMVSARAHRGALSPEKALETIYDGAGKQFDARLVDPFVAFVEANPGLVGTPEPLTPKAKPERTVREIILSIIQRFKTGDIELPVLSNIVHEIDRIIKDPTSTIDDLTQVVEKDAVISLRLISVANSALYRGFEEIRTLKQAIPRLGIKETRNVIQTIVNRGLYETDNAKFKELMEKLWLHSLACAYFSREIAGMLNLGDTDRYFLLGLVHDIGKVLLVKTLSGIVSGRNGLDMDAVVSNIQSMHCSFGAALMRRWNFDTVFVRVATLHEGPAFSETTEKEILVVSLANLFTRTIGHSLFEETVDFDQLDAFHLLGLDQQRIDGLHDKVSGFMQAAAGLF